MQVMVGIRYQGSGGGSAMLTQLLEFEVVPQIGDYIEILPERGGPGQDRHVSEWHEPVVDRWLHRSQDYALEVHVVPPGLRFPPRDLFDQGVRTKRLVEITGVLAELREAGWS